MLFCGVISAAVVFLSNKLFLTLRQQVSVVVFPPPCLNPLGSQHHLIKRNSITKGKQKDSNPALGKLFTDLVIVTQKITYARLRFSTFSHPDYCHFQLLKAIQIQNTKNCCTIMNVNEVSNNVVYGSFDKKADLSDPRIALI